MSKLKTLAEHLAAWDRGDAVFTVEMGGLGPGYEQAIQILAIEIMRDYLDKPLLGEDPAWWRTFGDATVARIDYRKPDGSYACGGFSGAQVGAAKQIAYRFLKEGPQAAMADLPSDRLILVSRAFPQAPAPRSTT